MDLPNLFSAPAAAQDKLFLGILLTNKTVQAALWKVDQGKIVIAQQSSVYDYSDEESCLVSTDKSLQDLGKDSENVEDVVFGFESDWVTPAGIADPKKPLLKKLTQKLSLKPVGFVVLNEALFQHLKNQEPFLSCLVGLLLPSQVTVLLIHQGVLIATEHVGRSGNCAADFTEALARIQANKTVPTPEVLPTKIQIVYSGMSEAEAIKQQQQLIDAKWVEQHGFVQPPTVDVMPEATILEAVVMQGGQAVAESQGLLQPKESKADGTALSAVNLGTTESHPEEFGFAEVNMNPVAAAANDYAVDEPYQASFGVPIAAHHLPTAASEHEPVINAHPHHTTHHVAHHDHQELPLEHTPHKKSLLPANVRHFIAKHRLFIGVGFTSGVLALLLLGYFGISLTVQADVAVKLKTQSLSEDVTVTLDPKVTQSDPSKKILAANLVSKELSGTQTVPSSGVKLVGDKAKGAVTILNKTDAVKTFTAGTRLSSGAIQYVLDSDVTVASASVSRSGSDGETKTYGKADTNVTAVAIGEDSNLAKDKELKVADFANSTYSAVAKDAIGGGTSREIQVVSEKDREKVLTAVKADLLKQAEEAFKSESSNGQYTVPSGNLTVVTATYDAKVGDEVNTLKLDLTAKVEGVAYQVQDLQPLAQALLSDQVPSGYQLSTQPPQILSNPSSTASSSARVSLDMNITSQAIPQIDQEAWKQELSGLSLKKAQEQLAAKSEVREATIALRPGLAEWLLAYLPGKTNKIHLEVTE